MIDLPKKCPVCGCDQVHKNKLLCGFAHGRCMYDEVIVTDLRAENERLKELLKNAITDIDFLQEYDFWDYTTDKISCSGCDAEKDFPHAPNCKRGKFFADIRAALEVENE